jgi:sulfate permease, SulP family
MTTLTPNSAAMPAPARWMPALAWLRRYQARGLAPDAVAGLTLAAYMLPAAIGDAFLANLAPEAGIYACIFGGAVFWLFCSSRFTVVTVTSAISLMVGSSLGELAGGDATRFGALAACTALIVAAAALAGWLVGAGAIASFISESVLDGWKCGVAIFLGVTQLPKLLGLNAAHGGFWERGSHLISHLRETSSVSMIVGGASLVVLVLGRLYLKRFPVALVVVIVAIAASISLGLEGRGVKLLGEVPGGLPTPGLPAVGRS